ncbi:MAG: hypothetical protein WC767_03530 [Candidatus Paceibacterota bacterium]|jgi:phosphohistidine phosphatase SixA
MRKLRLKRLTILRHGPSDREGFLTPEGFDVIDRLTKNLLSRGFIDARTSFICSDQLRTLKTLQRIIRTADIDADDMGYEELFSLEERCDVPGAIRVIQEHAAIEGAEKMVVITHLEMAEQLPRAWGEQVLHAPTPFPSYRFNHGEGISIDCVEKTCEVIGN